MSTSQMPSLLRAKTFLVICAIVASSGAVGQERTDGTTVLHDQSPRAESAQRCEGAEEKEGEQVQLLSPVAGQGTFTVPVLPGGASAELIVHRPASDFEGQPSATIEWLGSVVAGQQTAESQKLPILALSAVPAQAEQTKLAVLVPNPPGAWPPWQWARVSVTASMQSSSAAESSPELVFSNAVMISVRWFAVLLTLLSVGVIYPGCAALIWHMRMRRYRRAALKSAAKPPAKPAGFWETLDPVQLTAGALGRASLSKLQIFGFTLLVFGLLLYFLLRIGLLSGLSEDVLVLLGISAAGAAGGKLTAVMKNRLRLDNWVWLRQKRWLVGEEDVAPRARWRELVTDGRELDVYSFQMAVFSLVVAVSLVTAGATALATFDIPPELLTLLGISQVVYVGGKAINPSSRAELDEKLTEVRALEQQFKLKAAAALAGKGGSPTLSDAITNAQAEYQSYRTAVEQAAEMFHAIYGRRIEDSQLLEPEMPKLA
jgi:hypothetical protein